MNRTDPDDKSARSRRWPATALVREAGDPERYGDWDGDGGLGLEILALACPDWRHAALAVDAQSGDIAYANWHALALLEMRAPITLLGRKLAFTDAAPNQDYLAALQRIGARNAEDAVFMFSGRGGKVWFSVRLHNPQGLFREVLSRGLRAAGVDSRIVFADITTSGMATGDAEMSAFATAFNLTAAEAELTFALVGGATLEDVAARRGAAVSTVRQRLKSVMAKTGRHRQVDLVRLVLALCWRDWQAPRLYPAWDG